MALSPTTQNIIFFCNIQCMYSKSGGLSLLDINISATMETLTNIPTQIKSMHNAHTETHEKDDICESVM